MTEYTIQNNADATLSGLCHKIAKVFNIAKHGVDLMVIACIVVMIALRFEHGIEINTGDAKFLQVIEFADDPAQISAKEVIGDDFLCVGILEIHGVVRPVRADDRPFLADNRITCPREAVREDLVHDGILEPIGRTRPLVVNRYLIGGRRLL